MTSVSGTRTLASLSGVGVRFGNSSSERALIDVSLTISSGERIALLGASGAGKSTLLDVLGGRQRPTSGTATIVGVDLDHASGRSARLARARIGMVAQQSELVPSLSVHQNVLLGRAGSQRAATTLWNLARRSDAVEVQTSLAAVGLAELADRSTATLSGGQRQRASIARMHYQAADLVLADEPVSNLDPARSDAVLELLTGLVEGHPDRALVIALHDPDLARRYCDRLIGIVDGRVQFDLATAEVNDTAIAGLYASNANNGGVHGDSDPDLLGGDDDPVAAMPGR